MKEKLAAVSNLLFPIACLVVIVIGGLQIRDRWKGRPSLAPQSIEPVDPSKLTIDTTHATIASRGTPVVVLIEFSDFECPFCGQYARNVHPQLWKDFVESGQVAYAFFAFPLERIHPRALRAGEAAECMGRQGKFWEMRDLLFRNQRSLDEESLNDHARSLSVELPDFQVCLEQNTMLPRIRAQIGVGQAAAVNSTPTFFVGRFETARTVRVLYRLHGAQSYSVFADALKEVLQ